MTTLNSRHRAYGFRVNTNNNTGKPSGKRPYAGRKKTQFVRPQATYGNPSWEEMVAKVEAMSVGSPTKRKS